MTNATSTLASGSASPWSNGLNILALFGISGVLLFAFFWQVVYAELPCPLCLLQRAAFVMAGVGFLLNVRYGASSLHYAVVIASAAVGMIAASRQVLLHIAPGDPGFGSPFLGMHFYTWALVGYFALIVFSAFMLALDRRAIDNAKPLVVGTAALVAMWLFFVLVVANAASTTLECGFGPCPDDPVEYQWLPHRGT